MPSNCIIIKNECPQIVSLFFYKFPGTLVWDWGIKLPMEQYLWNFLVNFEINALFDQTRVFMVKIKSLWPLPGAQAITF